MSKIQIRNHGFIEPEIKDEDYVLGGYTKLGRNVLQPEGQWDNFLPEEELQKKNGVESSNCTVYGTLNCIETLHKRLFDKEENYSERYIGVLAGTTPTGNSVSNVVDTIRKKGLIKEILLPFDDKITTWNEYYSPNPMTEGYLKWGENWLTRYTFGHEWVFTRNSFNKHKKLKEALKYSPIGVSVIAWAKNDQGLYYKPQGYNDNHWVECYGFVEGKYWKIFDHYNNTHKKLVWDYDFGFAKRYSLEKKPIHEETIKTSLSIVEMLKKAVQVLKDKLQRSLGKLLNKS